MWGSAESVAIPSGLAAGGIDYPLPGGEVTAIRAVCFTVSCSGGGATRQVVVQLVDASGAPIFAIVAPGTQASGETVVYSFAPGLTAFGSAALGTMGDCFPDAAYADNLRLLVQVVSAGGSDTITNARALVSQYERADPYTVEAERMAGT